MDKQKIKIDEERLLIEREAFKKELFIINEKRLLLSLEDFKKEVPKKVIADINALPNCNEIDSIERQLEYYDIALYNFGINVKKKNSKYRKMFVELGDIHTEEIFFLTKRKIEFLNEILSLFKDKQIKTIADFYNNNLKPNKEIINEVILGNDINKSTIEDYLEPIKNCFQKEADYYKVIDNLVDYFEEKKVEIYKPYRIKSGNMTKLGKALYGIYKDIACKPLTKDYLLLAIKMFSSFEKQTLSKEKLVNNNIYKYFTAK